MAAQTLRRPDARLASLLALSIALHLLMLSPLALRLFGPAVPEHQALPNMPVYIQMEPRPLLDGEAGRSPPATARDPTAPGSVTTSPLLATLPVPRAAIRPPLDAPAAPVAAFPAPIAPRDADLAARIGASLARGTGGCRNLSSASSEQRAACDQAFADVEVARMTGTDDPRRDARFAALGDQALAEYDARRAALKPHSRANPCPHMTDIMGRCPVQVVVPLWSSNDGFLPGLKRD